MVIMVARPETYQRVVRFRTHAFQGYPSQLNEGETVLLCQADAPSKRRGPYIKYFARAQQVRRANPLELERLFPGVAAAERWQYAVDLYAITPLTRPMYLYDVLKRPEISYHNAQVHTRLRRSDERQLFDWLCRYEPRLVCDLMNADPEAEERLVA